MRFRKCENWGWLKGLIILCEQPIMIQQIEVCRKFYFKPKIKLTINTLQTITDSFESAKMGKLQKPRFWYSKIRGIFYQKFVFACRNRIFGTTFQIFPKKYLVENHKFVWNNLKWFTWYKMISYLNTFWNLPACPKSFSITWCFAGSFYAVHLPFLPDFATLNMPLLSRFLTDHLIKFMNFKSQDSQVSRFLERSNLKLM